MNPLSFSTLRQLSDGKFHSCKDIATLLGVSRNAVRESLKPFGEAGIEMSRVPGRGYCLREPIEWLDKRVIFSAMGERASLYNMIILDQVDSTNRALLQKAALGEPHATCMVAELQTAGRGRRGRAWFANIGGGLTLSVLWRFRQGVNFLTGLSLAVGVAVVRALHEAGAADIALKWPNDVLYQNRKLAGILIEMQSDVCGSCAAVMGIGLNMKLSKTILKYIDQPAVDISSVMQQRNRMMALILTHLADVMVEFASQGFSGLRKEWKQYHFYQGKTVCLLMPDGMRQEGVLLDVADDGALLLEISEGVRRFTVGEISLRGL